MLKKTFLLACLCAPMAMADTIQQVSGIVVDADSGEPIIGAAVMVVNTTIGTITDIDGRFTLTDLPASVKEGDLLEISYVGMTPVRVPIQAGEMRVTLKEDRQQLDEVVVTAMGISREKKALGYAMTELEGEDMLRTRGGMSNPVNALQGKVAGLQISSMGGSMGGSSKILIRGANSISGNNQPLFVIDGVPIEGSDFNKEGTANGSGGYDYGNLVQDINPDDIESLSVLKGASASALYGSRANNGVILITTKKGKQEEGLGISFSSTVGLEVISKLPKFQNLYGGGSDPNGFETATINGKRYQLPAYGTDESWGPRFEGQEVLSWYDLAKWEAGGKVGDPTTSKWQAAKHDVRDFYQTGLSFTNNVAVSRANELQALRISYTNTETKGTLPNSRLQKNQLNVSGSLKSNDKKLEVFTNVTYTNQRGKGRDATGYEERNVFMAISQWWQRQLDFQEMKDLYVMPDGSQATWNRTAYDQPNPAYHDNPYWTRYMNYETDSRNRIYGNVGLSYQLFPWLKAQYKTNLDFFVDKQQERKAVGSNDQSSYSEVSRQQYELNHEFLLLLNKQWGDYSLNATLGANLMHRHYEYLEGKSSGGLAIAGFYNLKNSIEQPISVDEQSCRSIRSFFGNVSVGWKSMVYLEATLRNDKSSTLPKDNNSYVYPSVTASFLWGDLLRERMPWLSFGKLRAGWAKVGSDTDPYRLLTTYRQYTNIGSLPGYLLQKELANANLKPESTYSWELGLEAAFLKNRLGFDLTYYDSETRDQIVPFSVSATSGYTGALVNAGVMTNRGVEFTLHATPVSAHQFEWNTTLTLSSNRSRVEKLIDEVDYYRIASGRVAGEIGAYVGERYGVIMGSNFVFDSEGRRMIDPETGLYRISNGSENLGCVYPDFTGGWNNSFRWGHVDASVQIDFQKGGHYLSGSYMFGQYSGLLEETAANGVRENGLLLEGVIDDKGTPNTTRVSAYDYYHSFYDGPVAQSVLRTDCVRLREVSVGYTFSLPAACPLKQLRLSAFGRNLGVWGPDTKHYDPEVAVTSSGNIQGLESGASPATANFGFTLQVKL